ncbi:MAG: protease inhibitor I42 family protein [Theionarchaea archaeon]|nr:protease inhibitor I42 family protein [Theionarchaea archaeon]
MTKEVKVNQKFTLSVEANPTTGYTWEVHVDETMLQLAEKQFDLYSTETIGGGGTETFTFIPLKTGETHVTMQYKRPWEEEAVEEKQIQVVITE